MHSVLKHKWEAAAKLKQRGQGGAELATDSGDPRSPLP